MKDLYKAMLGLNGIVPRHHLLIRIYPCKKR